MDIPFETLGETPFERLNAIDSLHFVMDEPKLPQVICTTITVDTSTAEHEVNPELWREHLARRCARLPFLHRIYRRNPAGRGFWEHTPILDPDRHFPHQLHDGPQTDKVRTDYLAERFKVPFDQRYPMWEIASLHSADTPEITIYIRLHHSLLDGMFAFGAFMVLFDQSNEPPDWGQPATQPAAIQEGVRQSDAHLRTIGRRHSVQAKVEALRDIPHIARDLRSAARKRKEITAGAQQQHVAPSYGPRTSWGRKPSSGKLHVAWGRVEAPRIKAIATKLDAPFSAVAIACATAGFRGKLLDDGITPTKPIVSGYPVSTRELENFFASGNHTGSFNMPLPVHIADPVERVQFVKEAHKLGKDLYNAGDLRIQERLFRFVPMRLAGKLATAYGRLGAAKLHPQAFDTFLTVLPLPWDSAYVYGAKITDLFSSSALNHLNHCELIGVRSGGILRIAFSSDPANFTGGDLFMARMLDEVTVLEKQLQVAQPGGGIPS